MHPYMTGETARQHSLELTRAAAVHRSTHIRRPASASGIRSRAQARLDDGIRRADAGVRQTLGWTLIRVGMRMVDPALPRGAAK